MKIVDPDRLIRDALSAEWDAFAREHPNLASVLSEELLAESCAESLLDDDDYAHAMATAAAVNAGYAVLEQTVGKFVRRWLQRLV